MRALDNWITYEDTFGNPFQGKFTFYKLGTSELITITDVNNTPLPNPILSDMHGRTSQQVFLPDIDVTVVMHKWIGPGSMAEADTNDNHWTFVRSFDNLTEVVQTSINSEIVNAIRVPTYNALQTVVVPEGVQYAILCGYYEYGDMPPVNYKLVRQDLSGNVNGGSVIPSSGDPNITDAYWVLIPDRVIDCRVFGVFPRNSYATPTAYSSQLAHCFNYANSIGHDVYMPQVFQSTNNASVYSYYWLEGGSFYLSTRLIVDKNVKICLKTGTTNIMSLYEIKHDGGLYIFSGNGGSGSITLTVTGEMRASWFNPNWAVFPGTVRKVILDTRTNPFTFKNTIVEVEKIQTGRTFAFEDCYIESNHKFKNCNLSFTRCGYVSDKWLDVGNTVTLIGNQIELSNMSSANAYIEWKNKQLEYDYGDLGEQEIDASVHAGGTIENCYGKITIIGTGHGNFEFHNVTLDIYGATATDNFNAVDSWLTNKDATVIGALRILRGAFSGNAIQVLTSAYFNNADLNAVITTYGANTEFRNSKINANVFSKAIVLVSNQISSTIDQSEQSAVIEGSIIGNIWVGGSKHYIHSNTEDTVVNNVWKDNHMAYDCLTPELYFIQMDRTNFVQDDRNHNYVWKDNDPLPVIKNTMMAKFPEVLETVTGNWVRAYNRGSEDGSIGYCDFNWNNVTSSGISYSQWGLEIAIFRVGIYPRRDSYINIKPWDRGKYTDPDYPALPYANPYYRFIEANIPLVFHDSGASTYATIFKFGTDVNSTYRMFFHATFMYGIPNRIINNRLIYEIPEDIRGQDLEDCTFNLFGEVTYV